MGNHYIIMADVVGSRKLDARKVMTRLSSATQKVNVEFMYDVLSPLTITLGDEYQGVVNDLASALKIVFKIEERFIREEAGFKLKHVVWFGEIDTGINPVSAHGMLGSGLAAAREKLAELKASDQRFFIHTGHKELDATLAPALSLYQFFVDEWSEKDYPVVASFLDLEDYKRVAEDLGRDVSLMWRRERSLHMKEYSNIKKLLILLSQSKPLEPGLYFDCRFDFGNWRGCILLHLQIPHLSFEWREEYEDRPSSGKRYS